MKKTFVVILCITVTVGIVAFVFSLRASQSPYAMYQYREGDSKFFFSYPKDFMIASLDTSSGDGKTLRILAEIDMPDVYFPNTNLSEARFFVSHILDADTATCFTVEYAERKVDIDIHGRAFTIFDSHDAGAGNFYETKQFRTWTERGCFELAYTIHSKNILNYDPKDGIQEFDRQAVGTLFKGIVTSFRFTH